METCLRGGIASIRAQPLLLDLYRQMIRHDSDTKASAYAERAHYLTCALQGFSKERERFALSLDPRRETQGRLDGASAITSKAAVCTARPLGLKTSWSLPIRGEPSLCRPVSMPCCQPAAQIEDSRFPQMPTAFSAAAGVDGLAESSLVQSNAVYLGAIFVAWPNNTFNAGSRRS